MYVIVLKKFGKTDVDLYYNITNDSWAKDFNYATKIKNRRYANILREFLSMRFWCDVVEVEENKITTNYINTLKIGDIFHNDNGEDYLILSVDATNDYTLLFRASNKYTPFVWAYGIREDSWIQGHYFKDIHEAMEYYNNSNKPETFTVHIYDEDELIDMSTFTDRLDAIQYAIETAAQEVVNDKTGEVIYTK